jgi:hypothetical protein
MITGPVRRRTCSHDQNWCHERASCHQIALPDYYMNYDTKPVVVIDSVRVWPAQEAPSDYGRAAFTSASNRRRPTKLVDSAGSLPVAARLETGTAPV